MLLAPLYKVINSITNHHFCVTLNQEFQVTILNFVPHPKAYQVDPHCPEQGWVTLVRDSFFRSGMVLLPSDWSDFSRLLNTYITPELSLFLMP